MGGGGGGKGGLGSIKGGETIRGGRGGRGGGGETENKKHQQPTKIKYHKYPSASPLTIFKIRPTSAENLSKSGNM